MIDTTCNDPVVDEIDLPIGGEIAQTQSQDLLATLLCLSAGFSYGYQTGALGPALATYDDKFPIQQLVGCGDECSSGVVSLIAGVFVAGAMLSNTLAGRAAGKFGLGKLNLAAGVLICLAVAGTQLSTDLTSFVCWRAFTGVGVGLLSYSVPLFVAERSQPESRGRIVGYFGISITLGIFGSFLVGYCCQQWSNSESLPWRVIFGAPGAASVLMTAASLGLLLTSSDAPDAADDSLEEGQQINHQLTLRHVVFAIGLAACQQLTGINAIIQYGPDIFTRAGLSDPLMCALITNGTNTFFTALSTVVTDRVGRRPLILVACCMMTVSLFGLSVTFFLGGKLTVVFVLLLYYAGFALGPGPLFYVISAETFGDEVRESGIALSNLMLWSFNLVTVTAFPPLFDSVGPKWVFLMFGFVGIACVVFIFFGVEETKGVDMRSPTASPMASPSQLESGSHSKLHSRE